jgi:hypothetical protein
VVLGAGAGVGVAIAATVAPRLGSMLYHVNPRDVMILAAAPVLLALTGLIAAVWAAAPVLRADPAVTLRE